MVRTRAGSRLWAAAEALGSGSESAPGVAGWASAVPAGDWEVADPGPAAAVAAGTAASEDLGAPDFSPSGA
ncbi:hypothetical protein SCYAM73S_05549 [Streptomyces cyaneofuscatus]